MTITYNLKMTEFPFPLLSSRSAFLQANTVNQKKKLCEHENNTEKKETATRNQSNEKACLSR